MALSYDSGQGNGPFGLGWSLDLPTIRRKTTRGVPRYDGDDVFVVAGEDLVEATLAGLPTELELDGATFVIQRYRRRVERDFARIERWTRDDGDVHWRVISADNVTSVFGTDAHSRVQDPAQPQRIFEWRIVRRWDDRHNVTEFEWQPETGIGIDPRSPHEARRQRLAQRYLRTIRYGNTVPYPSADFDSHNAWRFEVELDYGHETAVRVDPFSNCRAGFEVRTYRLCQQVRMHHRFDDLERSRQHVRTMRLSYEHSPVATKLSAIEVLGHDGADVVTRPPVTFEYTTAVAAQEIERAEPRWLSDVASDNVLFVDLEAEGLAGILHQNAGRWLYQRNLGDGLFAPPTPRDAPTIARGPVQLIDVDGDGRLEIVSRQALVGFQADAEFQPFGAVANVDWGNPDLRMVDVTGDGRPDILITEQDCLLYHPSRGRDGWGPSQRVATALDERHGPRVVFANAREAIHTADMTGDGLSDIVRIRAGEICYWPNLGYGRFGPQVVMDHPPELPSPLDTARLRLGDVDGSGTTDIIYLDDRVTWWLNQSGNGFGPPQVVDVFCAADQLVDIEVRDIDGSGLASLVWRSNLPADASGPLRYLRLLDDGKPYLLREIDNAMGAITRVDYVPSTTFYLADAAAGRPWKTKLPFPVHVVARHETYDAIRGNRFVTRHAYHDGYHDPIEREFHGFGHVDTWDTEFFDELGTEALFGSGPTDDPSHVPPVYTRSWFHLGIDVDQSGSWFAGDPAAYTVEATQLPPGLTPEEERQAHRALKGTPIRTEVYGLDGTADAEIPYVVTQQRAWIQLVQPADPAEHAVFHVCEGESLSHYYERHLDDPRVTHSLTVAVGPYGARRITAEIAYPRRGAPFEAEQSRGAVVLTEAEFAHVDTSFEAWRLNVPIASRRYELTGVDLSDQIVSGELGTASRRLLSHKRVRYYRSSLDESDPLPFGEVEAHAQVFETYRLAVDETMLGAPELGGRFSAADLRDAGYRNDVEGRDTWWAASGRETFEPSTPFRQPTGMRDAFGEHTVTGWDSDHLFIVYARDAAGNETRLTYDYHALSPSVSEDPNGNGTRVSYDAAGLPSAIARYGSDGEGDTLADPTIRVEYDWFAFDRTRGSARPQPGWVHSWARETYGDPGSRWLETRRYFDGFEREVMVMSQAATGRVEDWSGSEPVAEFTSTDRWIASGAKLLNNKGGVVREYHPFFVDGVDFVDVDELVGLGTGPTQHYDPVGRVHRITHRDGSLERIEFDPWRVERWDQNDTVLDAGNQWYIEHSASTARPEYQRAAAKAAAHAGTPTVEHLDPLGRVFLTVAHERVDGTDSFLPTRTELDVEGRAVSLTNARLNLVEARGFGYGDVTLTHVSAEAGQRWQLTDVTGQPHITWDDLGREVRVEYDELRRPARQTILEAGTIRVSGRTVYGEALGDTAARSRNLRGQAWLAFDGAGLAEVDQIDFHGNVIEQHRRMALAFDREPDWSPLDAMSVAEFTATDLLDSERFTTRTSVDALGRPVELTHPDGSVHHYRYDRGGQLEQIDATVAGTRRRYSYDAEYDAFGRRVGVTRHTGARTTHTYDPITQRLRRIQTVAGGAVLQDLRHDFDVVGNVTEVFDAAIEPVYFRNEVVEGRSAYTYSATYRLIEATGRESASGGLQDHTDIGWGDRIPAHDGALRNYTRSYRYDEAGNMRSMSHQANGTTFGRAFEIASDSNRLEADVVGAARTTYGYDAHGNLLSLPHLAVMDWNYLGQLVHTVRDGTGEEAFFSYDRSGQRVRKVRVAGTMREERLYFGPVEVFRRYRGAEAAPSDEAWTTIVAHGAEPCCIVETPTVQDRATVPRVPRRRWRLHNHLGSSTVELADDLTPLTYEEYFPYGTTAFRSQSASLSKRYRYTGMERDEETGLGYHTARYYVPWLARWASCDPIGVDGGLNLYQYGGANPLMFVDPSGAQPLRPEGSIVVGVEVNVGSNEESVELVLQAQGELQFGDDPAADEGVTGAVSASAALRVGLFERVRGVEITGHSVEIQAGVGASIEIAEPGDEEAFDDLRFATGWMTTWRLLGSDDADLSGTNGRTGDFFLEFGARGWVGRVDYENNADHAGGDTADDGMTLGLRFSLTSPWMIDPEGATRFTLGLAYSAFVADFDNTERTEGQTHYEGSGPFSGRSEFQLSLEGEATRVTTSGAAGGPSVTAGFSLGLDAPALSWMPDAIHRDRRLPLLPNPARAPAIYNQFRLRTGALFDSRLR